MLTSRVSARLRREKCSKKKNQGAGIFQFWRIDLRFTSDIVEGGVLGIPHGPMIGWSQLKYGILPLPIVIYVKDCIFRYALFLRDDNDCH